MLAPIQVMMPGAFVSSSGQRVDFTETMLRDCAAIYDPLTYEAPIVVGHPENDAPAYGWISGLTFVGGVLLAMPHRVAPEMEEAVRAGHFKKVSGSFFLPDTENNPTPGYAYLRHVGFLGGAAPAVTALKPLSFSDRAEDIRLPGDFDSNAQRVELHRRAVSFRERHGGDYLTAVRAVCREDQW